MNPDTCSVLIDYTLPTQTDLHQMQAIKELICHGFRWATREGPLAHEPVKNVKIKIIKARIADEPMNRGGSQIIPMVRQAIFCSLLSATP